MRKIILLFYFNPIIFFFINYISCDHVNRLADEKIEWYNRDEAGINGYNTYGDYFKITNYSNKSILASGLFAFAQKYVDTVHTNKPVSLVAFTGETSFHKLPPPDKDYFDKERKQALIWFGFDNGFPFNSSKKKVELSNLIVWKDGKGITYDYSVSSGKRVIDSILNSKEPFDNGF